MPKLLSVNVSLPKEIEFKGKVVSTGIFKEPIKGRVNVRKLNIDGDGQADLIGHGGEFRAVYVYSNDNYAHWEKELSRNEFSIGQFGENFTVEEMLDHDVHVGDQYRIGSTLFEVTQPRVPCYKLAIKMVTEGFYSQILKSGRLGFYFKVLEEGEVGAGDEIKLENKATNGITIFEINQLMYFDKENYQRFREALKINALSPGWKSVFEDRLAKEKISSVSKEAYRILEVTKKIPESEDITSFYLEAVDNKPLDPFLPGQFLPLKLDIPGQYQPILRTYTLSDSPSEKFYRLTIKREKAPPHLPNAYPGVSSNYFHNQVEVGSKITTKAPRGKFYLNMNKEIPLVFLSAGVGITPMLSMLNAVTNEQPARSIWFIHGVRSKKHQVMGEYIRKLAKQRENLNVYIKYSQPASQDQLGKDYDEQGYIDIDVIKRLVPGTACDFYLCGPPPFMKSLFSGLLDWGVDEQNINYEFFGPASLLDERSKVATPKRIAEATECCNEIEVEFYKSELKVNWNPSYESILDLAEAHGLSPDYSCRSGICHTCICKLAHGEVDYVMEPMDLPKKSNVLICCSKPKTNIVIEI